MNILFLAYEVESNSIAELSSYYKKKGHNCIILNCDFWTFYSNKNFYDLYKDKCHKYFNLEDEYKKLDETSSAKEVDYDFLRNFEKKYNFLFNDLIKSDPILYTATHERDYYNVPPEFIKHKWIELLSKKLENICIENQIDKAVTINNNYFLKNLGHVTFPYLKIEYLCLLPTRVDDYFMIYDNFGIGSPNLISENIDKNENYNHYSSKIDDICNSVLNKNMPLYKSHLKISGKKNNFLTEIIGVLQNTIFLLKSNFKNFIKNRNYKKKYFAPLIFKEIIFPFRNNLIRKPILEFSNILKKEIPNNLKYYYYGLHYHPESSLLSFSKQHDESEVLLKICADLDVDTYLLVKENPSMMGQRDPIFYKKLSQVHNLIFIHPSVDSVTLTKKSIGVIGLAGTILVEACILDKKALVIADPEYLALNYVKKYSKENLSLMKLNIKNNVKSYINLILQHGKKLDMRSILYSPYSPNFDYDQWKLEVLKITSLIDRYIK